ncbi:NAD(P)-binding protein [Amniculicola lignicola CBS 123094]|uniref:NAD(P)-binding protein n=1 Tax=Amniculicola lignicola CBS 123094 TaxID=1392246 RepID=A0A6A5WSQ3_9PLEO|nr:NAD(P)-binding protein [Amniculicola lignicola CBS 123094]
MAPIRVGIVGLSTNSSASSWSKVAHLPYLKASPHYEIAGICNSTLASSQAAVEAFDLPSAEAFANIESMSADPNIDLITVCGPVRMHASMVKPALEAGKNVYCEWPLVRTYKEAQELADLAKKNNAQTYIGLESRISPPWLKLRHLLSSNTIGNVLTTNAVADLGPLPQAWVKSGPFYLDVKSGQSPLNTRFAHFLDGFCCTLGEFESFVPMLVTHQKEVKVYNVPISGLGEATQEPNEPFEMTSRTAPDEILLQGKLKTGTIASIHFRSGPAESDGNNLRWVIVGTAGVIELTQKSGQFGRDMSFKIKVVKNGEAEDIDIDWETEGEFKMFGSAVVLTTPGRNYKAIVEGIKEGIVDFEHAARRQKVIEEIIERGFQV